MHVRELVDVAAIVALNGPSLVAGASQPALAHLEQYWSTSKCRFDEWSRVLKNYTQGHDRDLPRDPDAWVEMRATLDEIFVGEILTRVWTAVLACCDRRAAGKSSEPIARSILATHLEARKRSLALLIQDSQITAPQAVAVNRLRRRSERWTDLLLGGLWRIGDVREFAVDAERAEDFAVDLDRRACFPGGKEAWRLALVSLRAAFESGLSPVAANPDANARITAAILGCFPADLFDSSGLFRSLWMVRIAANACDAQGLISELLQAHAPAVPPAIALRPHRRA